jgi:hypothetical protein
MRARCGPDVACTHTQSALNVVAEPGAVGGGRPKQLASKPARASLGSFVDVEVLPPLTRSGSLPPGK